MVSVCFPEECVGRNNVKDDVAEVGGEGHHVEQDIADWQELHAHGSSLIVCVALGVHLIIGLNYDITCVSCFFKKKTLVHISLDSHAIIAFGFDIKCILIQLNDNFIIS